MCVLEFQCVWVCRVLWVCKNTNKIQGSTQIVCVPILAFGIEAVQEPVGVRVGAPVPLALLKQREKSITWVAEVLNDFLIFCDLLYKGPGWQWDWSQWCNGLSTPPSVEPCDRGRCCCQAVKQSRFSQWCRCITFCGFKGPCQTFFNFLRRKRRCP
jgi:hypothetical protein